MKYVILPIIIFLGIVPPAMADDIDFKGFPLGGKMEDFKRQFPSFNCTALDRCSSNSSCISGKMMELTKMPERGQPDKRPRGKELEKEIEAIIRKCSLTYGGISIPSASATFKEGMLREIYMNIKPDEFDMLEEALKERYGNPTHHSNKVVQNRMGAKFVNQESTWVKSNGEIWIEKYSDNLDESVVNILSQEALQELHQQAKQRRQAAPGDL